MAKWVLHRSSWRRFAVKASQAPVVGPFLRRVGEVVLPRDSRFWIQVEAGPAKRIWLKVTARVGSSQASGDMESAVQEALVRLLQPGMVFYDAGANVGYYSLLAARIVGINGKVLAFEPDTEVRGWLAENVRRNGMEDLIAIHPYALWRTTEMLRFERADSSASPDRGTGHIGGVATTRANAVSVQGTSLDSFCFGGDADNGRNAVVPDLVKVDVEGAECELLAGATQLLANCRSIWIIEIHEPPGLQPVRKMLAEAGYETLALEPGDPGNRSRALHVVAAKVELGRSALPREAYTSLQEQ